MIDHQPPENWAASVAQNPFSQQRIERLAYRFPNGAGWETNLHQLQQLHFRALIVGSHGTGKSTLVREFQKQLLGEERSVRPITEPCPTKLAVDRSLGESIRSTFLLDIPRVGARTSRGSRYDVPSRRQQRSSLIDQLRELDSGTLLLVDGIERLTWLDRQRLVHKTASESQVAGLVVIVHHRCNLLRLPIWIKTQPTEDLLIELVDELLVGQPESIRSRMDHRARDLFQEHRPDIRATLRQLFDEWALMVRVGGR